MTQSESPIVARQLLWTYWGMSEDAIDRDFYFSLQSAVATSIRERLRRGERIWVGREMQLQVGAYIIRTRLTNIAPPLATIIDPTTEFVARYREKAKDEGQDISTFLAEVIRYPNEQLGIAYDALIGIDTIKADMERKLKFLLRPGMVDQWLENNYGLDSSVQLMQALHDRYPLLILEGDVGSGKTALARNIGHTLAERLKTQVALFVVNAQVRGGGHVGELTQNISRAFNEAERCQEQEQIPVILLIDEADALAQARGSRQTHHEDDAGVNTLIQRIDRLRGRPMAVIFATNLFQTLDSAILRRATATFHFSRPSFLQRKEVFRKLLEPIGFNDNKITSLAMWTNPRRIGNNYHRYTYSDLSQRFMPYAVENAVNAKQQLELVHFEVAYRQILPTPESFHGDSISHEKYPGFYDPDYAKRLKQKQIAASKAPPTEPNTLTSEQNIVTTEPIIA